MNPPRDAGALDRQGLGARRGPGAIGPTDGGAKDPPSVLPPMAGDLPLQDEPAVVRSGDHTSVVATLITISGLIDAAITAEKSRPGGGDAAFLLGMTLIAGRAANLLPEDYVDEPLSPGEEVPAAPPGRGALRLLREAEDLTRAHEVEDFPPGISGLVVSLIDLIRDWTP